MNALYSTDAPDTIAVPSSKVRVPWTAWAACLVGLIVLYLPTLQGLRYSWDTDPNYSHGYFVPFISAAIAYMLFRKHDIPSRAGQPIRGSLFLLIGIGTHLAAVIRREPPLDYLGLFLILRGILVYLGGDRWASRFTFAILFLFFMFPLPILWTGTAALWLQDLVAHVSEEVIGWFVVCYRQGHTLHLAGMQGSLVVAAECSGLRQLVAFVAFASLYGYLLHRSLLRRMLLLIAAVPVAVIANVIRVLIMNLGAYWLGTNWLSGLLHHAPVLFSLPVGLLLFLFCDLLLLGNSANSGKDEEISLSERVASKAETADSSVRLAYKLLWLGFAMMLAVGAEWALTQHIAAVGPSAYPEIRGSFQQLPQQFHTVEGSKSTDWLGRDELERRDLILSKLPFEPADLLSRRYISKQQNTLIDLYVVHTRDGEDRKHHPEICIREVSGAPEDLDARKAIALAGNDQRRVQRFRFITGAGRSIVVYYWTYTFSPLPVPGRTFLQRMHQNTGIESPSITIQVTTGSSEPEKLNEIETSFLPWLDNMMVQTLLPENTRMRHDRQPIGLAR